MTYQKCIVATCLFLAANAAQAALVINTTFNDAQFSANGYSAADITNIHSAFNFAANEFQSAFSDNIHVNITVTSGTTGLGSSSTNLLGILNYSQMKNLLTADATTANDAIANASLPATNPTANDAYWVSRAQAKALGVIGDDNANDGTITFSNAVSYTFDPNNRNVAGKFDFIGVAEHEISEVMGRIFLLGQNLSGQNSYLANDLFRFTSAGTRNFSTSANGVYLSIDNGVTTLAGFNSNAAGDLQDYNGDLATDPFNAFTGPGQDHKLNATNLINMDVIGYNLITAVPEPSTFILALLGVGSMAGYRRRQPIV